MENALVSQNSLFWNKLGRWQVLATLLTLVAFFITLHLTGDKEKAFAITAITAAITAAFPTAFAFAFAITAITAAFVIFAAFAITAITAAFVIFAAFATAFVLAISDEAKKYGIKKKVVWLSFMAEFACIFLPMLLA